MNKKVNRKKNKKKKNKTSNFVVWVELALILFAGLKMFVIESSTLDLQRRLWKTVSDIRTIQMMGDSITDKEKMEKSIKKSIWGTLGTGKTYCLTPSTRGHPEGMTFSIEGLDIVTGIMATVGNKKVPCKKVWFERKAGKIGEIKKTEDRVQVLDGIFWTLGVLLIGLRIKGLF